jgi:hypothetical protein
MLFTTSNWAPRVCKCAPGAIFDTPLGAATSGVLMFWFMLAAVLQNANHP